MTNESTDRAEPMQGLAECPFCRNVPGPVLFNVINGFCAVVCNKCGAYGPTGDVPNSEDGAIRAWNLRSEVESSRQRPAAQAASCELGCTDVCKAREAGCASECPNPKIGRAIEAQAASAEPQPDDYEQEMADRAGIATPTGERPAAPAQDGVTLSAEDAHFLAVRLRRLCAHFNYTLPKFAEDDASLINIAGTVIGALLTNLAAAPAQAVRMLTREEMVDAFYNEQPGDDLVRVADVLRKFCEVNGIVPLSPQDTPKEGK